MSFKKSLSPQMIAALNQEYENGGWWRTLADEKETLIAIRDQYLNVYRNGCSIAVVSFVKGKLVASIHYKFLLKKKASPRPYVPCIDGVPQIEAHANYFISSLGQIEDIRYSTNLYGGEEKVGVHKIILANPNIVDTEIALSGEESDDENSRIDFCAIQSVDKKLTLRFFEAKHYTYTVALRATDGDAKVIRQLEKYANILNQKRAEILSAYKESIRLAGQIKGCNILGSQFSDSDLDNLELDVDPRLVIFGFDDDQKNGKNFQKHMGKLKEKINSRLLLKGSSNDFKVGISK